MLVNISNPGLDARSVRVGVYEIDRFNFDFDIKMSVGQMTFKEHYPSISSRDVDGYLGCYGVCDNWEQLLAACPNLDDGFETPYCVSLTPIHKADCDEFDGWRWHKWGEYIGVQTPSCEYLFDEPVIELVYCYHIYQIPAKGLSL